MIWFPAVISFAGLEFKKGIRIALHLIQTLREAVSDPPKNGGDIFQNGSEIES